MSPSASDWDVGQKLIDLGFCTMDHLREALSLKDETGRAVDDLLLERGHVTAEQVGEARRKLGLPPREHAPVRKPKPLPPPVSAAPGGRRGLGVIGLGFLAVVMGVVFLLKVMEGGPASVKAPAPAGPKGDVEGAAAGALEKVHAFAASKAGFEGAAEVIRRYEEFMTRHAGRGIELEAGRSLKEYRARLEEAAKKDLDDLKSRAAGLGLEEALGLHRAYPSKFLDVTESGRAVSARIMELQGKLQEEAIRKARETRLNARLRREVSDRYLALDGAFKEAMRLRDPRAAAGVVAGFLAGSWKDEEKPFVLVEGVDYPGLTKAVANWDAAEVAALCGAAAADAPAPDGLLPSETALLDLRNAALVALFLKDAGFVPGVEASDAELVARAEKGGSTDARIGFFCYYAGGPLQGRAVEALIRAHERGMRGVRVFMANLVAADQKTLGRLLEAKFGAAETYLARKQWAPAKAILEQVQKQGDHPFVVRRKPEIEKMLHQATLEVEADRALSQKYKGRVERLDASVLRVTYDFETQDQLDPFEGVAEEGGRAFKGRWGIGAGAMESAYATSVMRWRTPVKGDVTVEYDLMLLEEAQNHVLDLYYNRGAARHYAVVLGFDWVSRSEGDPDNSVEDRFGMARACVLKFPVAVQKSEWKNEEPWRVWRSRLVGRAVRDWKPERDRSMRLRVERQGKAIRLSADGAPAWEGEDAEYSEGSLLFFSDCRSRIDNLSITFRP